MDHEIIIQMYKDRNRYNRKFKAKLYMDAVYKFCDKYMNFFREMNDELEETYNNYMQENRDRENDGTEGASSDVQDVPEPVGGKINELAEEFVNTMAALVRSKGKLTDISEVGDTSKNPIGRDMLDINMYLVMFVFPCIIETKQKFCKELTEAMVSKWNASFKKTNISYADYETIDSGFKRKLCYITTAVCGEMGLADDCEELTLLRQFRDGYMMHTEGGKKMVEQYYEEAPAIVCGINTRSDAGEIYRMLYDRYILPCTGMIREGRMEECMQHYRTMVNEWGEYIEC